MLLENNIFSTVMYLMTGLSIIVNHNNNKTYKKYQFLINGPFFW